MFNVDEIDSWSLFYSFQFVLTAAHCLSWGKDVLKSRVLVSTEITIFVYFKKLEHFTNEIDFSLIIKWSSFLEQSQNGDFWNRPQIGGHNLDVTEAGSVYRNIKKIKIHIKYNSTTTDYDVALVTNDRFSVLWFL